MKFSKCLLSLATAGILSTTASATELEVTHWWTSGGEAAAVKELAKLFDQSGHKWVDGAIAGSASVARPVIISRIVGGDPMAATQLNHGKQAQELIEEGMLLDLTDVAEANDWANKVVPQSLLDACTYEGRIYCAPVNIHSWQWMWLSNKAYADAGVAVPTNWGEFVAAAPALEKAGKVPLAMGQQGWQASGAFGVLMAALAGKDIYNQVLGDHDADLAAGPEMAKVFKAADDARKLAVNSKVQDWNLATAMVINGEAGGQIMGDWAQGEFQVAGKEVGKDYTCLPALGANEVISTSGDAFYFPVLDSEEKTKAQKELAQMIVSPEAQLAFNLKKGSLPVRGDIDLQSANECMAKGLQILANGNTIPSMEMLIDPDTLSQIEELSIEFFNDPSMTAETAQARFVELIEDAE
ncbi:MAG: ABC transporter substrate-binding protein [Pontibacterium sp.]